MATAIVVAGMHRSGTSVTAGALRMCGVHLGTELLEAGSDNRLGYWEHAGVVAIHERLLADLERGWDDVRALPVGWLNSQAALTAEAAIHELIESEFVSSMLWAIKDPRISRVLPLWKRILSQRGIRMVVLLVARRSSEVAASIQARNQWKPALSEMLWMRHVFDAERDSRDVKRCAITYDELISRPTEVMTGALDRLEVHSSLADISAEASLAQFVSKEERHHRHAEEPCTTESAAGRAFESLARIATSNDGWETLAELGRDFEASDLATSPFIAAVADWGGAFRVREATAIAKIHEVVSDLNAQNAWSVLAVEREQKLQDEIAGVRSQLNAQINWSDEAVIRERALREQLLRAEKTIGDQIEQIAVGIAERIDLATTRDSLITERDEFAARAHKLAAQLDSLLASKEALETQLASLLNSFSWRVSKPIRVIGRLLRG